MMMMMIIVNISLCKYNLQEAEDGRGDKGV